MMQLTHNSDKANLIIKSYQPGSLIVNEIVYHQSVIITHNTLEYWDVKTVSDLTPEHMEPLLKHSPEIILIGTGKNQVFISPPILRPLIEKNKGVELMSTLAACYTLKVLISENRAVVAGLIV